MLLRPSSRTKTVATIVIASLLLPLTVFAVPSEQEFAQVKSTFNDLWHSAADATQRRADLEQDLAQFDQKVQQAKVDLEEAVQNRRDVRSLIAERRKLFEILKAQIIVASDSEEFYREIVDQQRADYVAFIRYVASKEIAESEAGPAVGGSVLRHILRGSLGESVEDALAASALVKARNRFFLQAQFLVSESEQAKERLQIIADNLMEELEIHEGQSKTLGKVVDKQTSFIDNSWHERKLTEQELKTVAQEADEAQNRIASMRESLLTINAQLKEQRMSQLRSELQTLKNQKKDLETKRETLEQRDNAMRLLEEQAMRSLATAMQLRNSDKKLYKRLEQAELALVNKESVLQTLTGSGTVDIATGQIEKLTQEIQFLKEQIELMRIGVPADPAAEVVRTKHEAERATNERVSIGSEILDFQAKIDAFTPTISAKLVEIQKADQESGLDGLPPFFVWPVTGPISAGYLDADYERVFHIPHRAIDIAVPQGTAIKAITDGIVFAVRDGGAMGYSYILIGHQSGFASLYGHVSLALVKAGDTVHLGQTIGLSGGQPGTHGAGHMTTGPHLHLEMMKGGEHVNPFTVLPKK